MNCSIVFLETVPPRGIDVAWPFLISEFLRFIGFVLVLGLITCEKCVSGSVLEGGAWCVSSGSVDDELITTRSRGSFS